MYRVIGALPLLSVLNTIFANRDTRDDDFVLSASAAHRDTLLQVENVHLRSEVEELRTELRVAASGAFVKGHKASVASNGSEKELRPGSMLEKGETDGHILDRPFDEAAASRIGPDAGARPILAAEYMDISDSIAKDAAAVSEAIVASRGTKHPQVQGKNSTKTTAAAKVLFVIYSSAKSYETRMRWALDTWAKKLPSSQLVVVGDVEAGKLEGVNVHQTRCHIADHAVGMSCKYAEAVVVAQMILWQHPELEWAYLADDDTYIRAAVLEQTLQKQAPTLPHNRGVVLASFGCATANCSDLLCRGSGYAANRWAIEIMVSGDPKGFVQEMMRNSIHCTGGESVNNKTLLGDGGLSEVMQDRGIERRTLEGIYGWMLDKSCLEYSLESANEPVLYHMIRSRPQMEFLHRLFAPVEEQTGSSVPPGSDTALDGLGGCMEFQGNVQCASSRAEEDRPWHRGPGKCIRPNMPRLPILLGVFVLALLFIILVTFAWVGLRYQQWEGWKLNGVKWHTYPMQGRSRFR